LGERNEEVRQLRMDGANKLDAEVSANLSTLVFISLKVADISKLATISRTSVNRNWGRGFIELLDLNTIPRFINDINSIKAYPEFDRPPRIFAIL
jgi:hypothetical protein